MLGAQADPLPPRQLAHSIGLRRADVMQRGRAVRLGDVRAPALGRAAELLRQCHVRSRQH